MSGSKLLVLNSGSSSLKFKLFQVSTGLESNGLTAIASGACERVGDSRHSLLKVGCCFASTSSHLVALAIPVEH
jgi:acetate kinase